MRISVVTARYSITGVPLAQLRLARALVNAGHEVDLLIGEIEPGYAPPQEKGVNLIDLKRSQVRGIFWPLWSYLREIEPSVVFSAEDHLNVIVLLAAVASRSKAKISCSSRVTPFDTYSSVPLTKRWVLKQLARATMWRADALTCVSEDMVQQYRQVFNSPAHVCVYNIVDDGASRAKLGEPIEHPSFHHKSCPVIVAAGRLAPWKGFSDLIRAVGLLSKKRSIKLLILGDGPMRSELEALIIEQGLRDIVELPGYVSNPLKFFAHADAFVLSSHVEGLPNVLVEAMMCGCTPVSTDCPTGPREVLQGEEYGYLVPVHDPAALACGIEKALDQPIRKEKLAKAVRPFEERAVIAKHFEILGLPFTQ